METNKISLCAKSVSLDMKAPTEQTRNQHGNSDNNYMRSVGDQAVNNYMGSIGDQAVNNYMGGIGDQSVNNYMGIIGDEAVNNYRGSVGNQEDNRYYHNGSSFIGSHRDQADNQYSCRNSGYMDNLGQNVYNRQHQHRGQGTTNFLDFQHAAAFPQISHEPI